MPSRLTLRDQPVNRAGAFAIVCVISTLAALEGCGRMPTSQAVLLFAGSGTSSNDVKALETILDSTGVRHSTVSSVQLNAMSESQLAQYKLLIVPGGNFVTMGSHLTMDTMVKVRNAVNAGTNYLGICAGGFLAGRFPSPYNSFNLSAGVQFDFYFPEGVQGPVSELYGFRPEVGPQDAIRKAVVRIAPPAGPPMDHYWESGPQFNGWGAVVAKYPNGAPAIVEGHVGRGWVILSGVHPEAPESWRRGMSFTTRADETTEYAKALILAALRGIELPHY